VSNAHEPGVWPLQILTPPWTGSASIYEYILEDRSRFRLPDEPGDPGTLRWAPGAEDGTLSHHTSPGDEQKALTEAKNLEQSLKRLLESPEDASLKSFYEALLSSAALRIADGFLNLCRLNLLDHFRDRMAAVARYLASRAPHREPVKFGIMLLGLSGSATDVKFLETFALHEEFTLYASTALCHLVDDWEQCLWRLARKVRGWGRIHLVERLAGTVNPEIQAWMLREGFRNAIMDNYLAALCARSGRLHEALAAPAIDSALLDGAAGIIIGLLDMGPGDQIDEYEHTPEVLRLYFTHLLDSSGPGMEHLVACGQIRLFLASDYGWEDRFTSGWTAGLRATLLAHGGTVLRWEFWPRKIEDGLASTDTAIFSLADSGAMELGINTREAHYRRVRAEPLKSHSWFRLLQQTTEDQIDELLNFTLAAIPLEQVATGPEMHLGLGPGFEVHTILDFVLQELVRFPARGWPFLRAGLQSSTIRNRSLALRALLAWPREEWPAEAFALLQQAFSNEPDEKLKERLSQAIKVQ
jgi:hypothetical protein